MRSRFDLRLSTMKINKLLGLIIAGLFVIVICTVIAFTATPEMIKKISQPFKSCAAGETINCINSFAEQEFLVYLEDVQKENNFIYFQLTPSYTENFNGNLEVNLTYAILDEDQNEVAEDSIISEFNQSSPNFINYLIVFSTSSKYSFRVKFFTALTGVSSLNFNFKYLTEDFYAFLLITKYIFFCYTLFWIVYFFIAIKSMKFRFLPLETNGAILMNFSVLIFNEPLIGAYTSFSQTAFVGISVFCNVQFICSLIMYWLFMLKKLNNPYCQRLISLVEFIFICSLFSFLFVVYEYVNSKLKYDPSFNWQKDLSDSQLAIYKALISVISLFAFWMLVLILISLNKWKKDRLSAREKVYWAFNYTLIILTFIFIGLGYIQIMNYGQVILSVIALYNIFFSVLLLVSIPERKSYNDWVEKDHSQNEL